ncbi:MAG: hypothetical protein II684_02960 [Treponema sp.]|jgi:hypothetical protein|nr:hypothetical protein [Treponema sp.]MBR4464652.1 hypothetical protein [Treponema sp.]
MTLKERSLLFTVLTSICNIVITLIVEILLLVALFMLLRSVPSLSSSMPVQIIIPFILIAGLFISLMIFARFAGWVIKTFHLEDKIDEKIVNRYCPKDSL